MRAISKASRALQDTETSCFFTLLLYKTRQNMLPKLVQFNKKHNGTIKCNTRYCFVNLIQLRFCYYLSAESRSSELHTNSCIFKMSSICKYAARVASVHYNLMDTRANVVTTYVNVHSLKASKICMMANLKKCGGTVKVLPRFFHFIISFS